ncbi:hypothetical protein VA7868_00530 [Vibrio aerogenes CECT 7868]|uniref:Type VI secretion-associated protein, VC_A0118 family n=1 Tax=Vibrio aerogenes CECT 7868 TaxID=1216006 RepID=A0A1M5VW91_9VIBR|nr:type VI secretion system-associated protein VasI [Vibrio aerogenes]SHH79477.1 hypothetical protein VA7868_00530 [Vibrio aerogenes CECT 7868]
MKLRVSSLFISLILLIHTALVHAQDAPESDSKLLIEKAKQCRDVTERLDRLRCFDRVFDTPLMHIPKIVEHNQASVGWIRAMESAAKTQDGSMMNLTVQGTEDEHGNAWLTLLALNDQGRFSKDQKAVLMMSCIDKISRIDLALPEAIPEARVKVSVHGTTQYWRSDDAGLLLSSGRGMPAISLMRKIASQSSIALRSNAVKVDGLSFDTHELKQALKPLRKRCGW